MRLVFDKAGAAELLSTTPDRVDEFRRTAALAAVNRDGQPLYRLSDLLDYVTGLPAWTPDDEAEVEAAHAVAAVEAEARAEKKRLDVEDYARFLAEIKYREEHPITYLTRAEAAEWLGKTPQTLLAWAKEGFGPPFETRYARRYFYPLPELERWAKHHRIARKAMRPLGTYVRNGRQYRYGTGESVGLGGPDPLFGT